jgi:hypothetical protein
MSFGGGGGGQLTAHTHDPAIPLDGGSLAANATSFSLANQSLLVSDGVNIQELGIGSDGDNLTAIGGALSWEAHVAGDVLAANLVMANSTTIGDYTQPASATCSSAATASPTYDNSNFAAWSTTGTQVTESSNVISFDVQTRVTNNTTTTDLGSSLSNSTWLLRAKLIFTAFTQASPSTLLLDIGIGSAASSTPIDNSGVALDFIGIQERITQTTNVWGLAAYDSSGPWADAPEMDNDPVVQTYYLEIIRTSSTGMSIGLYSDAAFTTLIMPIETRSVPATVTNLRYLRVGNGIEAGETAGNQIEGTVEDFQIWDNNTSPSLGCNLAIDDNVATSWASTSEVNPNIYVDMSSSTTTSNLALYPNAGTTETEIKIQSSSDALAWTDERTITFSNLTTGAWNYIRFNLLAARYWRIYGSSGNAGVLQIDEIKVLDSVSDADVRNLHGHIPISSTDTSLNNAGV